jgi:hypothetical protein
VLSNVRTFTIKTKKQFVDYSNVHQLMAQRRPTIKSLICSVAKMYYVEAEGKTNREVWSMSKREQTTNALLRQQINSTCRLCRTSRVSTVRFFAEMVSENLLRLSGIRIFWISINLLDYFLLHCSITFPPSLFASFP